MSEVSVEQASLQALLTLFPKLSRVVNNKCNVQEALVQEVKQRVPYVEVMD